MNQTAHIELNRWVRFIDPHGFSESGIVARVGDSISVLSETFMYEVEPQKIEIVGREAAEWEIKGIWFAWVYKLMGVLDVGYHTDVSGIDPAYEIFASWPESWQEEFTRPNSEWGFGKIPLEFR